MNRAVEILSRRCARLCLTTQKTASLSSLSSPSTSSLYLPRGLPPPRSSTVLPLEDPSTLENVKHTPRILPGLAKSNLVYTFPTANRHPILDPPPFLNEIFEKCDPEMEKAPMEAPSAFPTITMYAGPRLLTIRRKKMKKHKRRKRYFRDFFKYQKYHREKKLRAEREFRARMKAMLTELETFNPEDYVKDTIAKASKEWRTELTPSGRKMYPHWSRLMALEELYGLDKDEYIDKKAGIPGEEDEERIQKLREEYKKTFGLLTAKKKSAVGDS